MLADYKGASNDPDLLRKYLPGETIIGVFFGPDDRIHLICQSGESVCIGVASGGTDLIYWRNNPRDLDKLLQNDMDRFEGYVQNMASLEEMRRLLARQAPPEVKPEETPTPPTKYEIIRGDHTGPETSAPPAHIVRA